MGEKRTDYISWDEYFMAVAKLAGMPASIVRRADEVLNHLETAHRNSESGNTPITPAASKQSGDGMQLSFFQLDDPVLMQIRDELLQVDINNLTPMEALNKLDTLKRIVTGK